MNHSTAIPLTQHWCDQQLFINLCQLHIYILDYHVAQGIVNGSQPLYCTQQFYRTRDQCCLNTDTQRISFYNHHSFWTVASLDQIPVSFNLHHIRQEVSSKYVHTSEIPISICSYHKWVFFKLSYHTCIPAHSGNKHDHLQNVNSKSICCYWALYVSKKKWLTKFLILILIIKIRWQNMKKYMLKQTTTSNSFHLTASKVQYIQLHVTKPVLTKKNYNNFLQKWLQTIYDNYLKKICL